MIAVHVYYIGTLNHAYQSGDLRQGMWAQLCTAEGETVFESDRSWKALHVSAWERTEVIAEGYDTQFRESIDAALLPIGWDNVGFDDSAWIPATEFRQDDHVLEAQRTAPLSFYVQRPAYMEMRNGVLFCDMGKKSPEP